MSNDHSIDDKATLSGLLNDTVQHMSEQYGNKMTVEQGQNGDYKIVTIAKPLGHAYGLEKEWKTSVKAEQINAAFNKAGGDINAAQEILQESVEQTMGRNWDEHYRMVMCAPENFKPTASFNGPLPGMSMKGRHEQYYTKKDEAVALVEVAKPVVKKTLFHRIFG